MMVSVSIITYNHEAFIAQAIESVLMQRTDFAYEILIGEDGSSDRTREIVQTYAARHPDRIRLFLHDRRQVIYVGGRPTSRWNLVNNLKNARGKYVALLDGDDYWTDPYKLQKQVDFLEANPGYALCITPVRVLRHDEHVGAQRAEVRGPARPAYTLDDLLRNNDMIFTCTVVFRNHLVETFPDWFYETPSGDWPLFVLNAHHGPIGVISDVTAVYRQHPGGMWSSLDPAEKLEFWIRGRETVLPHLQPHHRAICMGSLYRRYLQLLKLYGQQGRRPGVERCVRRCRQLRRYSPDARPWDRIKLAYYSLYSSRVDRLVRPLYSQLRALLTP